MSTPPAGIQFDKSINLGHVLTVLSFLIATVVQWNIMDKRVVVLEEYRSVQRERDNAQDTAAKEKSQELREVLGEIRRGVEKLSDRLPPTGGRR